jgi:acyl-CoA thioester hydrolase
MAEYNGHTYFVPIQVRFKDIDRLGHVNNANHHVFIETARVQFFTEKFGKENDFSKHGVILAHTEIDYIKPIFLFDKVFVTIKVTRLGNKSFDLEHYILKQDDKNEYHALACVKGVLVCIDYTVNKTISIPDHWRTIFEASII